MRFRKAAMIMAIVAAVSAPAIDCLAQETVSPGDLPKGKLLLSSGSAIYADFFIVDLSHKTGDIADIWIYIVTDPPLDIEGKRTAQTVSHIRINCATQTLTNLEATLYDQFDNKTGVNPGGEPQGIPPNSNQAIAARFYCGNEDATLRPQYNGYAEARAFALAEIKRRLAAKSSP